MKIYLKNFFLRFWHGEKRKSNYNHLFNEDLHQFTDEQKQEIVNCALTAASQVLISAAVMTNSHNEIVGECILPDESKWRLEFKRIEKLTVK